MTAGSIIVFSNGDRKLAANEEAIFSLLGRVNRAMTEEMTPASNVEEFLRVFPFFPVLVHSHTAVKRVARAQFQPKLSLNKVLNFRKFSLSSPKLRQSLKS